MAGNFETYGGITKHLQEHPETHLSLGHHDMTLGLRNVRWAAIMEPNPNAGKPNRNQMVIEAAHRHRRGLRYTATDTEVALDLLNGKLLGDDVSIEADMQPRPFVLNLEEVHGMDRPFGLGLDAWLFYGFSLQASAVEDGIRGDLYFNTMKHKRVPIATTTERTLGSVVLDFGVPRANNTIDHDLSRIPLLGQGYAAIAGIAQHRNLDFGEDKIITGREWLDSSPDLHDEGMLHRYGIPLTTAGLEAAYMAHFIDENFAAARTNESVVE